MRVFLLVMATLGLIAAAGVGHADDWRIEAGPVEVLPGEPVQVGGTFHVHAPAGTPADAAPRAGGACLIADLVPWGVGLPTCSSAADCNTPEAIDKASNPAFQDFQGYCLTRDGSGEPPHCWTRPGPPATHCLRSRDGLRLTPGTHRLPVVPADPLNQGDPLPQWVVFACMAGEDHPGACGVPISEHRQFSVTPRP